MHSLIEMHPLMALAGVCHATTKLCAHCAQNQNTHLCHNEAAITGNKARHSKHHEAN